MSPVCRVNHGIQIHPEGLCGNGRPKLLQPVEHADTLTVSWFARTSSAANGDTIPDLSLQIASTWRVYSKVHVVGGRYEDLRSRH